MPPNDAASPASARTAATHATPHIAVVGHVDHGKSTIVGRLLADTGNLPEGKVAAIEATCRRRGLPFEWAFVTDALQAERDQAVTVEVSHIGLRLDGRPIVLVDAPGHREFLKNMISGAARCDAALLVVDAAEGVQEQSRRHAYLLHLLGVGEVIVAVNKMDRAGFDAERFHAVAGEIGAYLRGLGVEPTATIPVSGREGDGIAAGSAQMPWYDGPSLAQALAVCAAPTPSADRPLRLPVQDVYRVGDRRIIVGRVESGTLQPGDRILVSPSNQSSTVATLEAWGGPAPARVSAGQSVGLTLADPLYVERGDLLSHETSPPAESDVFRGRVFWIGRAPLVAGGRYTLKLHTAAVPVTVQAIEAVIDTATLAHQPGERIARNEVGEVVLRTRRLLAFDPHDRNRATGRFVLVDGHDVAGGGLVSLEGYPDQRDLVTVKSTNVTAVAHRVTAAQRLAHNGHSGGVLWLTGLSGAGKSTLALALEQRLFAEGYQVYVLDGDNVRQGLNANLGFSPEDRAENIRRVGEVAALFADAGMIVISAFISPYQSDRSRARTAARDGMFHEIHVDAPLAECERRDPKGLYKRARAGEIADFTGISAPYEPPVNPELRLDTAREDVAQSVERLVAYVRKTFGASG